MNAMLNTTRLATLLAFGALAVPSQATVIFDYGSNGTPANFTNFFAPNAGPITNLTVNPDSVDAVATGMPAFRVLVLTSEPTQPLDLTGFDPNSHFEIDLEVLPQDEAVYFRFRLELQTQNGVDTSVYNFDFSPINGSVMSDGTGRINPTPGLFTISSRDFETLGSPTTRPGGSAPFADLSNINRVEIVYQSLFSDPNDRNGDTFALRINQIRLVPEPATAALCLLGLGGLVARRRR